MTSVALVPPLTPKRVDQSLPRFHTFRFEALKAQAEATLDARREKLASKLFEEERALQAELVASQVTPEERRAALEARARKLFAEREAERAQFAEQQLYRQWRAGCDGVRLGDSRAIQAETLEGRAAQVEHKVAVKEAKRREKVADDAAYELERLKKVERYEREVEERKALAKKAIQVLDEQVEENKVRRAVVIEANRRDVEDLKAKWATDEAKAAEEEAERARKAKVIGKEMLEFNIQKRQELAEAKARDIAINEKILADALASIAAEEAREAELRARKKEQDRVYREHLSALMVKDQVNEEERDRLVEAQQAKYDAKRQADKDREERARARLMEEVHADRQRQLAAKAAKRQMEEEDKMEERKRMEADLADLAIAEEEFNAQVNAVRVQNRLDIETQIQYKDSLDRKAKEEQKQAWEGAMQAERDYQRMIEYDAAQARPAHPNYARKSTQWYD